MPLYEFKCRDCEHVFEARIPWKAPFPECPECGCAEVKKVYHPAALIFKGSGWHVNDYGSNGANNGSTNGTSESASSESSTTSGSSSTKSSDSSSSTASSSSSSDG